MACSTLQRLEETLLRSARHHNLLASPEETVKSTSLQNEPAVRFRFQQQHISLATPNPKLCDSSWPTYT